MRLKPPMSEAWNRGADLLDVGRVDLGDGHALALAALALTGCRSTDQAASTPVDVGLTPGLSAGLVRGGRLAARLDVSTDGLVRAADLWDAISVAEVQHEKTFRALANNVECGNAFSRDTSKVWRCMNCGYIHEGQQAPDKCPACVRPSNYFELFTPRW